MKTLSIGGLILFSLMAGCGPSTQITSSWKAENMNPQNYKKIIVLGLVNEADRTLRESMEQHLVNDLKNLGYDAIGSTDEYNPKAFENVTEEQAISKLKSSGVDAVLTIVLLDKEKEKYYRPGRIYYSPYIIYHDRFWRYSTIMYHRVYTPGYYETNTKYFWESNLYDLASNQLVYSAQSQSFDPLSSEAMGHEYGQVILKDMVSKNILINTKSAVLRPM